MDILHKYGLLPHECSSIHVGDRFGRITILAVGKLASKKYQYRAVYKCDCGTESITQCGTIQIGTTQSCGCKNREDVTKHGLWKSPLYRVWQHMIQRCHNEKTQQYANYGGRGISVCKQWHDIEKFHDDMFDSYRVGLTIDRIDNNGNYEPSNCKWSTKEQQSRNKRSNILVTIDGQTKVLKDWCEQFNVSYHSVYYRIKVSGWEPIKALTHPSRRPKNNVLSLSAFT